ncbi:hypothetical protein G6F32_013006 [Rhizopus arrhizus]|nr:hypothetical protein G6F32_013006 [Rhizopus arrhizus]
MHSPAGTRSLPPMILVSSARWTTPVACCAPGRACWCWPIRSRRRGLRRYAGARWPSTMTSAWFCWSIHWNCSRRRPRCSSRPRSSALDSTCAAATCRRIGRHISLNRCRNCGASSAHAASTCRCCPPMRPAMPGWPRRRPRCRHECQPAAARRAAAAGPVVVATGTGLSDDRCRVATAAVGFRIPVVAASPPSAALVAAVRQGVGGLHRRGGGTGGDRRPAASCRAPDTPGQTRCLTHGAACWPRAPIGHAWMPAKWPRCAAGPARAIWQCCWSVGDESAGELLAVAGPAAGMAAGAAGIARCAPRLECGVDGRAPDRRIRGRACRIARRSAGGRVLDGGPAGATGIRQRPLRRRRHAFPGSVLEGAGGLPGRQVRGGLGRVLKSGNA